ncbi:MAG: alanine--glyoxylate aminotransferase family protein [Candidatus Omnitrophica bacterium]|nr:alanine--glyoxylate aminotransferase family protein [Candidatus Omnitrophota bacterium]
MIKNYLLTPGPTPVPPEALLAMARPIIHHRTPQFQQVMKEVQEGLRYAFQTKGEVLIFTSSGTGAMEGAVSNLLSPGDKAITVQGGKFGERWTEICRAYGVEAVAIDVEWGKAVDPKEIEKALSKHRDAKAVYTTLCETSTGVVTDIKAVAQITARTDAVLVVDAISGLGAVGCETDEWGIDVVVAGSQKGLMIPPGLAFASLSQKAWKLVEKSKCPKYYFDFKAAKKAIEKTDTPFTPALTLVIGLNEALKMIKQETLEKIMSRHMTMAKALREAATALGLELYSKTASSDAVTAVKVPQGIDGEKLVKTMRDEYGVGIAGGQAELKGKVFRIASMGYMNQFDIVVSISCLEIVLSKMGYKFELGAGVKAAQKVFLE